MITERIHLGSLVIEYQEAMIELVERLGWSYEIIGDVMEITVPEKDAGILDLIVGEVA